MNDAFLHMLKSERVSQHRPGVFWMNPRDYAALVEELSPVLPASVPLTWWTIFLAWAVWVFASNAAHGNATTRREFFRCLLPLALEEAERAAPSAVAP